MTRKERVAAAFSAAAATYDAAAEAQARAADLVARRVLSRPIPAAPRVLEVGCGTGLLTRRLLPLLGGDWLVTDIAPAMVAAARASACAPGAGFRVMDGEHPDVEGPFDLIVSNLAAQWFQDLPAALARLASLLAPGGRLVLSTLGEGSLREWRDAHAALGLACGTPAYPSRDQLADWLPAGRATGVVAEAFAVRYPDGRAFGAALKAIGAGTPKPGHRPLSPGALRRVLSVLGAPAAVTYEILIAEVR
ncbi:MAG: methyltransferase domain-containing protein [Pseudomonadota bacterium]